LNGVRSSDNRCIGWTLPSEFDYTGDISPVLSLS
jgi:hypothetical protein